MVLFGLGDVGRFHCCDCTLVSGPYPYTHHSSLVTTAIRKLEFPSASSSMPCAISRCCSSAALLAVLARNWLARYSCSIFAKIECTDPLCRSAGSRTVTPLSSITKVCTCLITLSFRLLMVCLSAVHLPLICVRLRSGCTATPRLSHSWHRPENQLDLANGFHQAFGKI